MEGQTSKKPQKLDKFPPCPLNNPYSYLNSYVTYCSTGTLLSRDVSQLKIRQGVLEKYVPPQSCRFRSKWGHVLGAVARLSRMVSPVCDTCLLQDAPAYETRHRSNFYLIRLRSSRAANHLTENVKNLGQVWGGCSQPLG